MGEVVNFEDIRHKAVMAECEPSVMRMARAVFTRLSIALYSLDYMNLSELYEKAIRLDPDMKSIDAIHQKEVLQAKAIIDDMNSKRTPA